MIAPPLFILAFMLPPAEKLDFAARYHERGDYEFAALLYDLFDDGRRHGAAFHAAQGNAHFLAGNLPQAIRAYRKGLHDQPLDKALAANLADARARVVDTPGVEATFWHSLWRQNAVRVGLGLWTLAWLALVFWIIARRRWKLVVAGLLLVSAASVAGWTCIQTDAGDSFAVVAEDRVVLRRGNGLSYEEVEAAGEVVLLHRGVEARVLVARPNGWAQLKLANGVTGWAPNEQLLMNPLP